MVQETPHLTSVPPEVLECIFDNLDLVNVKNVRLACKSLATVGPRFKTFFAQQTTDLTSDSLRQQRDLASHPHLCSAVSTLVVLATVIDTSELDRMIKTRRRRIAEVTGVFTTTSEPACTEAELHQAAADIEWMYTQQMYQKWQTLAESVDSLAEVLKLYGALDAINVDACVFKAPNKRVSTTEAGEWHPVFLRASEVYRITTLAIAKSHLSLKTLSIYRTTRRCSVPFDDITSLMTELASTTEFASTFSSLENLALSFSTRVETDFSKVVAAREGLTGAERAFHNAMGSTAGQFSAENAEAAAEENFPGIARMLSKMVALDSFDLHMLNAMKGPATGYEKIFVAIADEVKLPLTQVFLRGLPATEDSLLKFIGNHPKIKHLDIREMHLKSGKWIRIIQRLFQMPALLRLSLSNLWDEDGIFNLLSKGDDQKTVSEYMTRHSAYPCLRGTKVHTRDFDVEKLKSMGRVLEFTGMDIGRALGSPQVMQWSNSRRFHYAL